MSARGSLFLIGVYLPKGYPHLGVTEKPYTDLSQWPDSLMGLN